jgi:hypothetical protein
MSVAPQISACPRGAGPVDRGPEQSAADDDLRRAEDGCLFPVCMIGPAYEFALGDDREALAAPHPVWCEHRARTTARLRCVPPGVGELEATGNSAETFSEEFNLCREHADWLRARVGPRWLPDPLGASSTLPRTV